MPHYLVLPLDNYSGGNETQASRQGYEPLLFFNNQMYVQFMCEIIPTTGHNENHGLPIDFNSDIQPWVLS